eukprot:3180779-Karenia_brevis.AAC.1
MGRAEWEHEVREALRRSAWKAAAARRKDMHGIEDGVNREATGALLSSSNLTSVEKGFLRNILSGAMWTQDRKFRANLTDTDQCVHCGAGHVEDHCHMWWTCAAWAGIRKSYSDLTALNFEDLPSCLGCCGIMPETWTIPSTQPPPE